MPRKYKPLNKVKKHSKEDMQKALKMLEDGMSLRQAAEKSGIHYSVLYRHNKKGDEIKKKGGQTALSEEEEKIVVDRLKICSEWGYPVDSITLRLLVKEFLDRQGKINRKFKNNLPGKDFVYSLLNRHKTELSLRMCQNIKRTRAAISQEVINEYFNNLEKELKGVPASHIVNYDEINLSDDPGRKKVITRRGCKYPERVMNSTKASTSVMFAAKGDGTILPPYTVYKAQHLYQSWREGGPSHSRYNRTKSGWFDSFCFSDWVENVALPSLRHLDGVKYRYLIGDNLSSHLSLDTIKKCNDNNVKFIFLPSNSTHITQPLDVAFFRPLKMSWRLILEEWKNGPGRYEATIPKDKFPALLKKLLETCKPENVISGFRKCGIIPLDRQQVLKMIPSADIPAIPNQSNSKLNVSETPVEAIDNCFKELLKNLRQNDVSKPRKKRVKILVDPGKSVAVEDLEEVPVDNQSLPSEPVPVKSSSSKVEKIKKTKKSKKTSPASSSESDVSHYSLQDTDDDFVISSHSESDSEMQPLTIGTGTQNSFLPNDFAVVKVFGKTQNKFRLYVCKIKDYDEGGYICQFFKKILFAKKFTATEEESFVRKRDIVRKLGAPVTVAGSSRFHDMITFNDDISDLTIY